MNEIFLSIVFFSIFLLFFQAFVVVGMSLTAEMFSSAQLSYDPTLPLHAIQSPLQTNW